MKCEKCGSKGFEPGSIHNRTGGMGVNAIFRPQKSKLMTLNPDVQIEAIMCMNCGHIELYGDIEKARNLVSQKCSS